MQYEERYPKPITRLGSISKWLYDNAEVKLVQIQDGQREDQSPMFTGTVQGMMEYVNNLEGMGKFRLLDCTVEMIEAQNDCITIVVGQSWEKNTPRNRLDEIGDLAMLPPELIQLTKLQELLLIVGLDTPIQLVTEFRTGGYWKTIYRGLAENLIKEAGTTLRGYLSDPVKNVMVLDGYLTIGIRDRTIT